MQSQAAAWDEEPEPNPVAQIIGTRTVQVGTAAGVALAGLSAVLPRPMLLRMALAGGVLVTAGLSAYFVATFAARTSYGVKLLTRLSDDTHVALTFDDGPHPDTTPAILDALADAGQHATFFLVATRAERFPELTRRIADEGHAIGLHGVTHRTMVLLSPSRLEQELNEATKRIEAVLGKPLPVRYLRPPYGFKTFTVCQTAHRLGYPIVSWSLDVRDYKNNTVEERIERVASQLTPGDILLLHERPRDSASVAVVPHLLTLLHERNLTSVALPEFHREI